MPLKAKLVVVGGEVKTAEIKLRLPSTIGRGRGTTIMLPHPLVSRQHCELFEAEGTLMVRDLGSLNGTFVNNERITEAPLATGELLTVGTVTFRAVYDVPAENGTPPGSKAAATVAAPQRPVDPLARTIRSGPPEPIDLDEIDELGEDLEGDTAQDPGNVPAYFAGPQASSADKTDAIGENSDEIVTPKTLKLSSQAPVASQSTQRPQSAAKSQPPASPTATVPVKSGDETTYISGTEETESDEGDEDDLNDFLKSLG